MIIHFLGYFIAAFGLLVIFLPLTITELGRPRDGLFGVSAFLFGLVMFTSNYGLNLSVILAEISGIYMVGFLIVEVAQTRWQQLELDEKNRLKSIERWTTSLSELSASFLQLPLYIGKFFIFSRPKEGSTLSKKQWFRPDKQKNHTSDKIARSNTIKETDIKKEIF
tara:strand:+ start:229 stop:726 length:498 start_codon:yes stop_codon:yes gene_type:complete